jgi:hypothetical protein
LFGLRMNNPAWHLLHIYSSALLPLHVLSSSKWVNPFYFSLFFMSNFRRSFAVLFSVGLFLYVAMLVTNVILFSHFIFMTNFKWSITTCSSPVIIFSPVSLLCNRSRKSGECLWLISTSDFTANVTVLFFVNRGVCFLHASLKDTICLAAMLTHFQISVSWNVFLLAGTLQLLLYVFTTRSFRQSLRARLFLRAKCNQSISWSSAYYFRPQ